MVAFSRRSDFSEGQAGTTVSGAGNRIVDPRAIENARHRDGVCLAGLILRDGCVQGFDVHHIDTRGSGGDDALDNLICLCRKHHNAAHAGFISRGRLREILRLYWNYSYSSAQLEER